MASRQNQSVKRLQIDKANSIVVAIVAIAAFVTIASLMATRALIGQQSYQAKLITEKEKAKDQLKKNIEAVGPLTNSYNAFVSGAQNILGGNPAGSGARDGDNARLVLDALPSKYDFPALTTSLEKLILERGMTIESITGTDEELAQVDVDTAEPTPIEMPFQIVAAGPYANVQELVRVFDTYSIRPFHVQTLSVNAGEGNSLKLTLGAKTFYQPAKSLDITKKVVE